MPTFRFRSKPVIGNLDKVRAFGLFGFFLWISVLLFFASQLFLSVRYWRRFCFVDSKVLLVFVWFKIFSFYLEGLSYCRSCIIATLRTFPDIHPGYRYPLCSCLECDVSPVTQLLIAATLGLTAEETNIHNLAVRIERQGWVAIKSGTPHIYRVHYMEAISLRFLF